MKPRVITKCVANSYASPNERIIEYSHPAEQGIGGLISFAIMEDRTLSVSLYRHDPRVEIHVGKPEKK